MESDESAPTWMWTELVTEQIVDAHHHLWNLNKIYYPWLMERGVARFFGDPTPIQQHYQVGDFIEDIGDLIDHATDLRAATLLGLNQ